MAQRKWHYKLIEANHGVLQLEEYGRTRDIVHIKSAGSVHCIDTGEIIACAMTHYSALVDEIIEKYNKEMAP